MISIIAQTLPLFQCSKEKRQLCAAVSEARRAERVTDRHFCYELLTAAASMQGMKQQLNSARLASDTQNCIQAHQVSQFAPNGSLLQELSGSLLYLADPLGFPELSDLRFAVGCRVLPQNSLNSRGQNAVCLRICQAAIEGNLATSQMLVAEIQRPQNISTPSTFLDAGAKS